MLFDFYKSVRELFANCLRTEFKKERERKRFYSIFSKNVDKTRQVRRSVRTSQDKLEQVRKSQKKSEKVKTRLDKSGLVRPKQDKSGQVRTSQDKSGQDRTSQDKSGQVRTSQDKSGQVRTSQDNSGQVRTSSDLSWFVLTCLEKVFANCLRTVREQTSKKKRDRKRFYSIFSKKMFANKLARKIQINMDKC